MGRRAQRWYTSNALFSTKAPKKWKWLSVGLSMTLIVGIVVWGSKSTSTEQSPSFFKDQSCIDIATNTTEPYTEEYHFKENGVDVLGEMWADYHWEGSITKKMIDDMAERDPLDYDHFKIIDNKLYVWQTSRLRATVHASTRNKMLWNVLWMTLAWFKVPDVEFLVDYDDSQHHGGGPAMYIAFRRELEKLSGFTVPGMPAILYALGPQQMSVHHECLRTRYPVGRGRIPKAIWRGKWWRTQSTAVPRVKLVEAASKEEAIADIKFTSYEVRKLFFVGFGLWMIGFGLDLLLINQFVELGRVCVCREPTAVDSFDAGIKNWNVLPSNGLGMCEYILHSLCGGR